MNKVIIIGCSGSGKSTFARKLRDKTNLPLFYLDMIWHKADRTTITHEEFDLKLNEILNLDSWIIDGNYSRTMEIRLQKCDTVFYFDLPIEECIKGVENRIGGIREDMPWVENEFDPEFREWILNFPNKQIPQTKNLLEKYKDKANVVVFNTREQADEYIDNL